MENFKFFVKKSKLAFKCQFEGWQIANFINTDLSWESHFYWINWNSDLKKKEELVKNSENSFLNS